LLSDLFVGRKLLCDFLGPHFLMAEEWGFIWGVR
jgi:hypothetical protein